MSQSIPPFLCTTPVQFQFVELEPEIEEKIQHHIDQCHSSYPDTESAGTSSLPSTTSSSEKSIDLQKEKQCDHARLPRSRGTRKIKWTTDLDAKILRGRLLFKTWQQVANLVDPSKKTKGVTLSKRFSSLRRKMNELSEEQQELVKQIIAKHGEAKGSGAVLNNSEI